MTERADAGTAGGPRGIVVAIDDEAGLFPIARAIVAALPVRAFLALDGDLGAGKTTFVKSLAAAAGIPPGEVVSPTFGLIHLHPLPAGHPAERLVHADLYRLSGSSDLFELGWDEIIAAPGWVAAEWAGRIADALPPERLDVTIGIVSPTARRITFTSRGRSHLPVLESLSLLPGASGA
jgi:tRNA threonylcarbamoyladenosine biosynthesis protein TsaE